MEPRKVATVLFYLLPWCLQLSGKPNAGLLATVLAVCAALSWILLRGEPSIARYHAKHPNIATFVLTAAVVAGYGLSWVILRPNPPITPEQIAAAVVRALPTQSAQRPLPPSTEPPSRPAKPAPNIAPAVSPTAARERRLGLDAAQ